MPTKPEYNPIALSHRTLAKTLLPLKVVSFDEPVPTIHTLARVLLSAHTTHRRLHAVRKHLIDRDGRVPKTTATQGVLVSRVALDRVLPTNRDGQVYVETGVPDVRPLATPATAPDAVQHDPTATVERLAELYEELASDLTDAHGLGERLDEIVRDQLPTVADAEHWQVITVGSGAGAGWTMRSAPQRSVEVEWVTF